MHKVITAKLKLFFFIVTAEAALRKENVKTLGFLLHNVHIYFLK